MYEQVYYTLQIIVTIHNLSF